MRHTEELRDVGRAPEGDQVPAKEYIPQAGEAVAVLDQIGSRVGVFLTPVARCDPCFKETVDPTEAERLCRPLRPSPSAIHRFSVMSTTLRFSHRAVAFVG